MNRSLIAAHDFSKAKPFDIDTDHVMPTVLSESSEEWNVLHPMNNNDIHSNKIIDGRLNIPPPELVTGNDIPPPTEVVIDEALSF